MRFLVFTLAAIFLFALVSAQGHNDKDYRGAVEMTEKGECCQFWDKQSPHKHDRLPENYQNSGLGGYNLFSGWWAHMKCRNPDNEDGIWCYTMNPEIRWDYCSKNGPKCCTKVYLNVRKYGALNLWIKPVGSCITKGEYI